MSGLSEFFTPSQVYSLSQSPTEIKLLQALASEPEDVAEDRKFELQKQSTLRKALEECCSKLGSHYVNLIGNTVSGSTRQYADLEQTNIPMTLGTTAHLVHFQIAFRSRRMLQFEAAVWEA
jgi:hypothetical protein